MSAKTGGGKSNIRQASVSASINALVFLIGLTAGTARKPTRERVGGSASAPGSDFLPTLLAHR